MQTPVKNYRLPPETVSQIADLRETKNGRLTETSVVIAAVDCLHRRTYYGRRSADMTPPRRRTKG